MGAEILGGLAGSGLASLLAPKGGNQTTDLTESINTILNKALQQSIGTSTGYTNQAISQQQASLQAALAALTGANTTANQQATQTMQQGLQQSQQLRQPYSNAGLNATDAYAKTLGLATPKGGSVANAQAQQQAEQLMPLLQSLKKADGSGYGLGAAPTAPGAVTLDQFLPQISQNQINDYWNANAQKTGGGNFVYTGVGNEFARKGRGTTLAGNQNVRSAIQNQLATQAMQQAQQQQTQQYQQAQGQYQTQQGNYNQLQSLLGGMAPEQMQMLASQLKGKI